jgi:hypothetical protein
MSSSPAATREPMSLSDAISTSIRAFIWGIFGLAPLVGLLPALYAMVCWSRVHHFFRGEWNPASAYLAAGMVFAVLGFLSSVVIILCIAASVYLS